jgi:hypothetical protein
MQPVTRRIAIAVGVALVVIALLYFMRTRDKSSESSTAANAAVTAQPPTPSSMARSDSKPPQHVTKLASADERQRVANRIANAQATRHARPTERPSLPPAEARDEIEGIPPHVKDALMEAIPFLVECYKTTKLATKKAAVMMTLTGDPDIGTLIDAKQMVDQNGKPLAPELDECLRGTLSSLELPPLAEGNKLDVKYTFDFGEDK